MNIEKLQQVTYQEVEKYNIESCIKKPPVYTLQECLPFYTKAKLFDLAKEHNDHVSKYKKKAEMIELVEEIILKNIRKDSLYITNEERKTIAAVIQGAGANEINIEETRVFKDLGYIYWFYHNKEIQIVCPEEIAGIYMSTYEEDQKTAKLNEEMLKYTVALQNIYGVFEVDQLIKVWNKYNKKKISQDYAYEFMDMVGTRQRYFWWDPPYVVGDYFFHEEEYKEFLESRVLGEYYMPTEKEILFYMEEEFDIENIYYKKIRDYFKETNILSENQLDDLMVSIEISCIMNDLFQNILDEINDLGYKFQNLDVINNFIKNYIYLSNHTRKWHLKGYKPIELSDEKPKNNVIQLNNHREAKKKKIGRNQPCPCGSGKKYKFCCGR